MPTIAELRAKMPELNGLDDNQAVDALQQAYYPQVARDDLAKHLGVGAPKVESTDGDFMRGLKKAGYQIPQTIGGTMGLIGDATGADGLRDYGMGVFKANEDKIQSITKPSDSLSSVLNGEEGTGMVPWLKNAAGYTAGQAATALVTGGVGGFIGKQLAMRGIKTVGERAVEAAVAKQIAERGVKVGAVSALGASNLVQEAGSIYPDAVAQAEKDGRTLSGSDLARVGGSALAAAAVDTGMDAFIGHKILSGGRKPGESLGRAALREVPGMMAKEAATEGIQTGIERYGAQQDLTTADAIRDYVDSMGVGAVGGGMGGGVSVLRSQKVAESGPLSRAANIGIDEHILQLTHDPQPMIAFPDGSVGHKQDLAAYLSQFTDPEVRKAKEHELMGRDPKTGEKLAPEPAPDPTSAPSQEAETATMKAWGARHDPATHDYALNLMNAPGAKGQDLMVAPPPDGGGYTVVPSNWLTLDTQAKLADLQKPAKEGEAAPTVAKGKTDEAVPEAVRDGAGIAATAVRPGPADGSGPGNAEPVLGGETVADGAPGRKADTDPVRADPAADAKPALKGYEADPYAANIFHDPKLAAAFMKRKQIDPAKFEVVQTSRGRFGVKPKAQAAIELDAAAHGAATSPSNDLAEPTQAQKDAGNYQKGHVNLHGLDISVENPAGSERSGVDKSGKAWTSTLAHHYGYIKKTLGADGDHVDAFIGPNVASTRAFVVDQHHPEDGKWDEHKVILGADSLDQAREIYQANYAKGWKGAKSITETSVDGLKTWLKDGDTTQPFAPQAKESTDGQENHVPAENGPAADDLPAASAGAGRDQGGPAAGTAAADAATGNGVPAGDVQAEKAAGKVKPQADWQVKEAKKEAKLQEQIATAHANAAERAAKKDANENAVPSGNDSPVLPSDTEIDDGKGIPLAFFKKVKVQHEVWIEDEKAFGSDEVSAAVALKSVREDKKNLQALLKCLKG